MIKKRENNKLNWGWWTIALAALWVFSAGLIAITEGWADEKHVKPNANGQSKQGHEAPMQKGHGHGDEIRHGARPRAHGVGEKKMDPLAAKGRQLILTLHCNACHLVEPDIRHEHGEGHEQVAPDLSFEGDKVRPAWLFDFLKGPHRIRSTVKARMPNFLLSDREALALTKHIIADLRNRGLPLLPGKFNFLRKPSKENLDAGQLLASKDYLDCFKCHQLGDKKPVGPKADWTPDLVNARRRLNPDWIIHWLKDPQKIRPGTKMPTFFADRDSGPEDILGGDEDRQMIAIRDYLLSLGSEGSSEGYLAAEKYYPDVTTGEGWKLMAELNCAGCHDVGRMHEREEVAPPLAHEGSRVYKDWLINFLKKPHTIRPTGYIIGTTARMPDLRLSHDEAQAIAAYLMSLKYKKMPDLYSMYSSTDFARMGRESFVKQRCGACHRGSGNGPVSTKLEGPDLGSVGRRLKGPHLVLWLKGGYETVDTHPVVTNFNLSEKEIGSIVAYLMTLK